MTARWCRISYISRKVVRWKNGAGQQWLLSEVGSYAWRICRLKVLPDGSLLQYQFYIVLQYHFPASSSLHLEVRKGYKKVLVCLFVSRTMHGVGWTTARMWWRQSQLIWVLSPLINDESRVDRGKALPYTVLEFVVCPTPFFQMHWCTVFNKTIRNNQISRIYMEFFDLPPFASSDSGCVEYKWRLGPEHTHRLGTGIVCRYRLEGGIGYYRILNPMTCRIYKDKRYTK